MIILGIDPGTSKRNPAGLVVINSHIPTLLHHEEIYDESWEASARAIFSRAARLARQTGFEAVAYEYPHFANNPQVAIKLAHFGGIALAIGAYCGVPVVAISALETKQALTGDHMAKKEAMIKTAQLIFRAELSSHEADACGVALAGEGKLRVTV